MFCRKIFCGAGWDGKTKDWNLTNYQKCIGSPYGGAVTALAVTERALSAPYGGNSPKGRGKGGCAASPPNSQFAALLR